eukprot:1028545-Prorocentrum_minimum.AAC.1
MPHVILHLPLDGLHQGLARHLPRLPHQHGVRGDRGHQQLRGIGGQVNVQLRIGNIHAARSMKDQ